MNGNTAASADTAATEVARRRERWFVTGGLVLVCTLAWAWTLGGAGMDMTAMAMTQMAGINGWLMQPATWTAEHAALMFGMWWIMMIAMMLPTAAPTLMTLKHVVSGRLPPATSLALVGMFALGYLLMWGAFSLLATGLQWIMESTQLLSPMLEVTHAWLGAAILMAAGAWQLTPLKAACLRHCRSPLGYLIGHWRAGRRGALRMGLGHGAYCVGCCWFLMLLLFFGGIMNLYWVAGLMMYVIVEKLIPFGHWLGKLAGVGLLGWGAMLAVSASA